MPPRVLLQRMGERFRLLSSSGGRQDRQATLLAALNWSWDLLTPSEKHVLAQLSVFEGGWSLDAAEAVVDLSHLADPPWLPDAMQSLIDKSLLVDKPPNRFTMLGTVREYCADRLREFGPGEEAAARARHCRFFAGIPEAAATADACADLGNLVSACRAALAGHDAALAVGALRGTWAARSMRGPYRSAVDLAVQVRAMPWIGPPLAAWVEWIQASALRSTGEVKEAEALLVSALSKAREAGDLECEARVLVGLGAICTDNGLLDSAAEHHLQAMAAARAIGDGALECEARMSLGLVLDRKGDSVGSRGHYESALALARAIGHRRWEGGVLGNLGTWHANHGSPDEARLHFQSSLEAAVDVGDRRWEGNALCNLGLLQHMQGALESARETLLQALQVAREIGSERLEAVTLGNLGLVDVSAGLFDAASLHYEQALQVARRIGDRRAEGQFLGYLGLLQGQLRRIAEAIVNLQAGEAILVSLNDPSSVALLLAQRAEVEVIRGDVEAARRAAARARQLGEQLGEGSESELGLQLRRIERWIGREADPSVPQP